MMLSSHFQSKIRKLILELRKNAEAGLNCDYAQNKNSQAYGEKVSSFTHLTRDNILPP